MAYVKATKEHYTDWRFAALSLHKLSFENDGQTIHTYKLHLFQGRMKASSATMAFFFIKKPIATAADH